MNAGTLRDLSRAYAAGSIDREAYRRERRELLRRIVAGELPLVPYRRPEPDAPTVFPNADDEGDTTQEIIPGAAALAAARTERPRRWSLLVLAVVVFAAGWAALDYALRSGAPVAVIPASTRPTPDLFDGFLAANNWTEASLTAMRRAWDGLDTDARAALADGVSARRLTAAILDHVRAESALIELGDAEAALEAQAELFDFAAHLGLTDARLATARDAWAAEHQHRREATSAAASVAAGAAVEATLPAPASPSDNAAESAAESAPGTAPDAAAEAPPEVPPTTAEASAPATLEPATTIAPSVAVEAKPAAQAPRAAAAVPAKPSAGTASRSNCSADLAKTRRPYCIDLAAKFKGPALVVLPAGQFAMGGSESSEQPRRTVIIAAPFAIGMFEISAAEFAAYCAAAAVTCPAQPWDDASLPVVNVSWQEADAYAGWLSRTTGQRYRLPTEAEWEYAARAGSTSAYPAGDELLPTHARFSFKQRETTPVSATDRSLNRNAFRLFHMLGNVREWVLDHWAADYAGAPTDGATAVSNGNAERVVRGGSYADPATALRSAARDMLAATARDPYTGFRVVRLIE